MIWDDIRSQHADLKALDVHVIRAPFRLPNSRQFLQNPFVSAYSQRDLQAIEGSLPKRADGKKIDASWVKYPFENFCITSSNEEDDACLLVSCRNISATNWQAHQWMFYRPPHHGTAQIFSAHHFDVIDGCVQETVEDEARSNFLTTLVFSILALMSCKNVKMIERHAPRQQRRFAERKGLPLVSWHELVIPSSGGSGSGTGKSEPLALHWVRGHFKDYRESGLFGNQKGVYWWSPYLAGQADRVVLKDYKIAPPPLSCP